MQRTKPPRPQRRPAEAGPAAARRPRETSQAGQALQGLQVEGPVGGALKSCPGAPSPYALPTLWWNQESLLISEVSGTRPSNRFPFASAKPQADPAFHTGCHSGLCWQRLFRGKHEDVGPTRPARFEIVFIVIICGRFFPLVLADPPLSSVKEPSCFTGSMGLP